MRKVGVALALLALSAHAAVPAAGGEVGAADEGRIVASVYDGDTLTLTSGRRVRLRVARTRRPCNDRAV